MKHLGNEPPQCRVISFTPGDPESLEVRQGSESSIVDAFHAEVKRCRELKRSGQYTEPQIIQLIVNDCVEMEEKV